MKKLLFILLASLFLVFAAACGARMSDYSYPAVSETPAASAEATGTSAPASSQLTLAWFSDPQNYSQYYPRIFSSITAWIGANAAAENISYAVCTGDFVNDYSSDEQWKNASDAAAQLGSVPLFAAAGNHDIDGDNRKFDKFLKYFGKQNASGDAALGGMYQGGAGRYDLLDAGGASVLLLTAGFGIDDAAADWMNGVLAQYPDRTAILCVHSFIDAE